MCLCAHSLGYTATGFSKHTAVTDERRTYVEWLDDDVQKRTMKLLLKITGAIVASAILALVVLSITGLDPNQRRPGLWLKGNAVSFPTDWTFADKHQTLLVETHPSYLIPHSVTIFFVTDKSNLYLHADYPPGQSFPSGKSWTASIARNPKVRIEIGNEVFDGKAVLVTDAAEFNVLFEAFRRKYPRSPFSDYHRRGDVYFLRVLPR
jgi:hypothetical protein